MTARIDIAAAEAPTVRLFALALPREDIRLMAAHHDRAGWLSGLLGAPVTDPSQVETFDTADLGRMGLAAYLVEAQGVAEAALDPDRDRLAAVTGPVLILRTAAFGGRAVRLRLRPVLTPVGAWPEEPPAPVRFHPLPAGGAEGTLAAPAPPPPSQARTGGRVAMLALAAMFGLTALVVWIGG